MCKTLVWIETVTVLMNSVVEPWFRLRFKFRLRIPVIFGSFSTTTKCVKHLAFSMLETASFPSNFASPFKIFDFCIPFKVGSGSNSGPDSAKSCSSCGYGSTTLLIKRVCVALTSCRTWSRARSPRWMPRQSLGPWTRPNPPGSTAAG